MASASNGNQQLTAITVNGERREICVEPQNHC